MRIIAKVPLIRAAGVFCIALGGCGDGSAEREHPRKRPHVILISVDTLRADHLGCYGYARDTSPNIDRLAARSVRFENAFAQASWTLPSHMSIMTSQYPHVHGVEQQDQALPESALTLAEVLDNAGYLTAAMISWVFVGREYGFAQGFDEFVELVPPPEQVDSATSAAFRAEQVTDRAIEWLSRRQGEPFFLFLHYFDPHINYDAPEPYTTMFDPDYKGSARGDFDWISPYIKGLHHEPARVGMRDLKHLTARYDGEIRYTDHHIGRLIGALDQSVGLDNCLIVFTSDHGEELNEHGSLEGHQWTLYDEVVHVPLIIHPPGGLEGGAAVTTPAESIDIASTIAGWLGIAQPPSFQGDDFSGLLADPSLRIDAGFAFGEIRRFNRKQYIRSADFKLIHSDDIGLNARGVPVEPGYEMFDVRNDRRELVNIFRPSWPLAQRLVRELETRAASLPGKPSDGGKPARAAPTPDDQKRLRSLGYIGTAESGPG